MRPMRVGVPFVVLLVLVGCRERRLEEVELRLDASVLVSVEDAPRVERVLRASVAAIQSPADTFGGYSRLVTMLARDLGMSVTLVQRRSYRETNELLTSGKIDFAFVCTGGFLELERSGAKVDVLAVPVVRGATTYRSVVIVPAKSAASRLEDLEGKRFAFTDELSFSGYVWPNYAVRTRGLSPLRFFASSYFTHSHDRSVEAVARGFVDAAAVDSNILEDMLAAEPALRDQVRIVERSEPFGIPPVIALDSLDRAVRERVRESLLRMHERDGGSALLAHVGIERFVPAPPGLYDSASAVARGARE